MHGRCDRRLFWLLRHRRGRRTGDDLDGIFDVELAAAHQGEAQPDGVADPLHRAGPGAPRRHRGWGRLGADPRSGHLDLDHRWRGERRRHGHGHLELVGRRRHGNGAGRLHDGARLRPDRLLGSAPHPRRRFPGQGFARLLTEPGRRLRRGLRPRARGCHVFGKQIVGRDQRQVREELVRRRFGHVHASQAAEALRLLAQVAERGAAARAADQVRLELTAARRFQLGVDVAAQHEQAAPHSAISL
ncbi:MAG: hypothetical protein E6J45_05775 [Chloroflexi bacterium]|nr:MAG: hypothetical protein E6J45_05775 [Chloroflexota bacterium]